MSRFAEHHSWQGGEERAAGRREGGREGEGGRCQQSTPGGPHVPCRCQAKGGVNLYQGGGGGGGGIALQCLLCSAGVGRVVQGLPL